MVWSKTEQGRLIYGKKTYNARMFAYVSDKYTCTNLEVIYVTQPMHVYCVSVKHEELLVRIESYEIVIVQ